MPDQDQSSVEMLLARWRHGDLDEREAARLRAHLTGDPRLLQGAADDLLAERLIRASRGGEVRASRVLRAIGSGGDLAAAVMRRIARPSRRRLRSAAPRSRLPAWAAVGFAAAAVLAVAVLAPRTRGEPAGSGGQERDMVLSRSRGSVTVADARVEAGAVLRDGAALRVAAGASATVTFADGSRLEVAPETQVVLRAEPAKRLAMERGSVTVDAAPQPAGRPLVVETPDAVATVLGTRFTVDTDGVRTRLEVIEGTVRFASADGGDAEDIRAGGSSERSAVMTIEAESFSAPGGLAPADGPTDQPYLDVSDGASGSAVAIPSTTVGIRRRVALPAGAWRCWIRWRDDRGGPTRFAVSVDGREADRVVGNQRGNVWRWSKVDLVGGGDRTIAIDALTAAKPAEAEHYLPQAPHAVVVRIDRVVLTRSTSWRPPD